jgi:hypothetical protein
MTTTVNWTSGSAAVTAVPSWFLIAMEFHAARVGKDISIKEYPSREIITGDPPSSGESILIYLPNSSLCQGASRRIVSNGMRHFRVGDAYIRINAATYSRRDPTCHELADLISYGSSYAIDFGPKYVPVITFERRAICLNITFDRLLCEVGDSKARKKRNQPQDPVKIILDELGLFIDNYTEYASVLPEVLSEDRTRWAEFRAERTKQDIDRRQGHVDANMRSVMDYQNQIRDYLGKAHDERQQIAVLQLEIDSNADYEKEYLSIKGLCRSMYESFEPRRRGDFIATTTPITMRDRNNGDEYFMGQYRFVICLRDGGISVSSISNYTYNRHCHPHASSDGSLCLGNISATLPQLFREGHIIQGLELLHRWVTTYVSNDAYYQIGIAPGLNRTTGEQLPPSRCDSDEEEEPEYSCSLCGCGANGDEITRCEWCENMVGDCCSIVETFDTFFCGDDCAIAWEAEHIDMEGDQWEDTITHQREQAEVARRASRVLLEAQTLAAEASRRGAAAAAEAAARAAAEGSAPLTTELTGLNDAVSTVTDNATETSGVVLSETEEIPHDGQVTDRFGNDLVPAAPTEEASPLSEILEPTPEEAASMDAFTDLFNEGQQALENPESNQGTIER